MVSKASEDLPDPLRPVITVSVLRGISTEMFFKLCWRAPRTVILLMAMDLINLEQKLDSLTPSQKEHALQWASERSTRSSTPYVKRRPVRWSISTAARKHDSVNSTTCALSVTKGWHQGCNTSGNHEISLEIAENASHTGKPTGTQKRTIKEIGR